ncbi:unnamed protein product [Phyllotreta striolata]|uniref:Uncharacterized protein n=1 Tax=Phyllotreta striolata TaxID=444603 RepID=A0A9P0DJW5_PHYSR|nr:unnamed protein product [Phyllotreta striolata]
MKKIPATSKKSQPSMRVKKLDFLCSTATTEASGAYRNSFNGDTVEFSTILEKGNKTGNTFAERMKTFTTMKKTDNRILSKLEKTIQILSQKQNACLTAPNGSKEPMKINEKSKSLFHKKVPETVDHSKSGTDEDNNEQKLPHRQLRSKKVLEVDATENLTKIKKGREKKRKSEGPSSLDDATENLTKIKKGREKNRKSEGPSSLEDATENLTIINKESKKKTKRKSEKPSILDDTSPEKVVEIVKRGRPRKNFVNSVSQLDEASTGIFLKRGRPRKNFVNSVSQLDEASTAVKKKRGRPQINTLQSLSSNPSNRNNEETNKENSYDSAVESINETNSICKAAQCEVIDTIDDKGQIQRIRINKGSPKYKKDKRDDWSLAISSISTDKCSIMHYKIPPKKIKENCLLEEKYIIWFSVIYGHGLFINGKELIQIEEDSEVVVYGGSNYCIINNSEKTMILNCARVLKSKKNLPNCTT